MADLIDRQAAIDAIYTYIGNFDAMDANFLDGLKTAKDLMMQLPSAQPECKTWKWIPVKFRPMDSKEREYWEEQLGEELAYEVMFDCPIPEDGQEILVSYRKWICMDKCERDGVCCGLEGNGDWDGVIAWMPLPKPYERREDG